MIDAIKNFKETKALYRAISFIKNEWVKILLGLCLFALLSFCIYNTNTNTNTNTNNTNNTNTNTNTNLVENKEIDINNTKELNNIEELSAQIYQKILNDFENKNVSFDKNNFINPRDLSLETLKFLDEKITELVNLIKVLKENFQNNEISNFVKNEFKSSYLFNLKFNRINKNRDDNIYTLEQILDKDFNIDIFQILHDIKICIAIHNNNQEFLEKIKETNQRLNDFIKGKGLTGQDIDIKNLDKESLLSLFNDGENSKDISGILFDLQRHIDKMYFLSSESFKEMVTELQKLKLFSVKFKVPQEKEGSVILWGIGDYSSRDNQAILIDEKYYDKNIWLDSFFKIDLHIQTLIQSITTCLSELEEKSSVFNLIKTEKINSKNSYLSFN